MLTKEALTIDEQKVTAWICKFIVEQVDSSGLNGGVVAASGGIDSSLTLALAVKALGKERVVAVTMPERDVTPEEDINDVMQLTDALDVTCDTVEITPVLDELTSILPYCNPSALISFGNLKPRLRMTIAYHYANSLCSLVIGSSNKTEWLMGYFTKYGDGASDIMPVGDLYKTQVRQLARYLEIPERIISKPPSARLWKGQTTEGELGIKFETLDLILYGRELGMKVPEIAEELNIGEATIRKVFERVKLNEHKRRLPLILRLSP